LHAVRRGDVVVFDRPASLSDQDSHLVKRVIALAGETVSAHGGSVYIGARRLVEPYVNKACHGTLDFAPVVVPRGDVFVMGDNRCDSLDSRSFGPIPTSTIVGRAFVIVWPLGRLHWL
jgi:signal peptidase I